MPTSSSVEISPIICVYQKCVYVNLYGHTSNVHQYKSDATKPALICVNTYRQNLEKCMYTRFWILSTYWTDAIWWLTSQSVVEQYRWLVSNFDQDFLSELGLSARQLTWRSNVQHLTDTLNWEILLFLRSILGVATKSHFGHRISCNRCQLQLQPHSGGLQGQL